MTGSGTPATRERAERRPLRPRRQLTPARRGRSGGSPTGGTPPSTCGWTRPSGRTAADVVNQYDEDALVELFTDNGEGRFARRIARAIIAARPLTTTGQLADVVREAIPAATRRTGGHPARRVFQAIRIAVNEELDQLAHRARRRPRPPPARRAVRGHLLPLGRGPAGQVRSSPAWPPTTATARPACPACAVPTPSSGWWPAGPVARPRTRSVATAGPRPPASGSSSACPTPPTAAPRRLGPNGESGLMAPPASAARPRRPVAAPRPERPRPRRPPLRVFEPDAVADAGTRSVRDRPCGSRAPWWWGACWRWWSATPWSAEGQVRLADTQTPVGRGRPPRRRPGRGGREGRPPGGGEPGQEPGPGRASRRWSYLPQVPLNVPPLARTSPPHATATTPAGR